LKTPRKSLLALCLLALFVSGLTVALLLGRRDAGPAAVPEAGSSAAPDAGAEAFEAERDVDGEPVTSERAPRTWVLEFEGPGQRSGRASIPRPHAASELGSTPPARRELPRGSARIVFVVQDASGRPLLDVSVLLESLDPNGGAELAVTAAGGEARFLDLAPGPYAYLAQAPGGPEHAFDSFRLEPAEHKHLTLRLAGSGLSIAGRVRNRQGEPVAGIGVSVVRHRFASAVSEVGSRHASRRSTRTGASGAFAVGDLEEGEYDVLTSATDRYLPAKATVQAGTASADLILAEGVPVRGTVKDPNGEPLARVWVGVDWRRDRFAYTDAAGRYEFQLDSFSDDSDSTVRFYLRGYEEEKLALPAPGAGVAGARLDVELRPVENTVLVEGVVESERGDPIARAKIFLGSRELATHYKAVSDTDGRFSLADTKIGPGRRGTGCRAFASGSRAAPPPAALCRSPATREATSSWRRRRRAPSASTPVHRRA